MRRGSDFSIRGVWSWLKADAQRADLVSNGEHDSDSGHRQEGDGAEYRSRLVDVATPILWVGGACWVAAAIVLLFSVGVVLSGEVELGVGPFVPTVALLVLGSVLRGAGRRLSAGYGPGLPRVVGLAFAGAGAAMLLGGGVMALDDPAGLVLMAFGLVFVGAGYAVPRLVAASSGR